jgi:hypothetical protein
MTTMPPLQKIIQKFCKMKANKTMRGKEASNHRR